MRGKRCYLRSVRPNGVQLNHFGWSVENRGIRIVLYAGIRIAHLKPILWNFLCASRELAYIKWITRPARDN